MGRAAAALRPRDHEPGHQPVPGATHATELRQTLLFPPRPVTPASQCADRIACMRPRPGRIDPRQIAISPALVRDHSGRPRAYGVTGTLRLNGGTDGHQGQQADGKRGLSGRGLVHECRRVRNEWKWTERIERRGLASCAQVAKPTGKGAEIYERCMKLLSVTTKHAGSPSRATWAARLQARGLDKHKKT